MADEAQTSRQAPEVEALPPSPFKFLDPYGPEDAGLFFGRGFETAELYTRLYGGPVTVVYGESGTGKTSLIQCGLRNRVPAEDVLFVSVRTALDPETTLREELQKLVAPAEGGPEALDALLRRVIRRSYKTLVLVFDQFEEFFLFQPEDLRQAFGHRLSGWLAAGLNLRLVFAIREEYLARLTEVEGDLPGLYENRLWLRRMSRVQAQEVIAAPCRVAGVPIEPELVTALLDTLGAGGQGVELPILQVVLDTLYRQAVQQAETAPALTLQGYRDLGEAHRILGRFVDDRLAAYRDAESVRQVLKALVTIQGTRRLAPVAEIAERLLDFGIELTEEALRPLLRRLVDDRILREDPERHLFELRHDALAAHIHQWMSGLEQELANQRQAIQDRLPAYRQRGRLLDAEMLADLAPYEGRLRLRGEMAELMEHSTRRVRRRKQLQLWGGAGIVALVLAFGVFSFVQWQEAQSRFNDLRSLAKYVVFNLRPQIDQLPGSTPVRMKLVERALQYYDSLAREAKGDLSLQSELAAAYQEIGDAQGRPLYSNLGDTGGALESYRKALQIREQIATSSHNSRRQALLDLALSHDRYGDVLIVSGRAVKALENYRRELEILLPLSRSLPDYLPVKRDLGRAYLKVGDGLGMPGLASVGDTAGAMQNYRQSMVIRQEVVDVYPDNLQDRLDLAISLNRLAMSFQISGDLESAIKFEGRNLQITREALSAFIQRQQVQHQQAKRDVATSHANLGVLMATAGDSLGALSHLRESLKIAEELTRDDPQNANFNVNRASALQGIGRVLLVTGDSTRSEKNLRKASEILVTLLAKDPANEQVRQVLMAVNLQLAQTMQLMGRIDEARLMSTEALKLAEQTASTDPKNVIGSQAVAMTSGYHGGLLISLSNPTEAAEYVRRQIDIAENLAKHDPKSAAFQELLANALGTQAVWFEATGNPAEAEKSYGRGLTIAERLAASDRKNAVIKDLISAYRNLRANLRLAAEKIEAARADFEAAFQITEALVKADPADVDRRMRLSQLHTAMGFLLEKVGDSPNALDRLQRALKIAEGASAIDPANQNYRSSVSNLLSNLTSLSAKSGLAVKARRFGVQRLKMAKAQAERTGATAEDMASFALLLLSIEPAELRKPAMAVSYAKRAVESSGGRNYNLFRILISAYVKNNDRKNALAAAQQALALTKEGSPERQEIEGFLKKMVTTSGTEKSN